MKINKKIVLIIAGILFGAGLVLFTVGLSLENFDLTKISTEGESVRGTYTANNIITEIDVKDCDYGIVLTRSTSDKVKVTYTENKKHKYIINESDQGTLSIKSDSSSGLRWFSLDFSNKKLCIEIPESFNGKLDLETNDGRIDISKVKASEIELVTSDGRIVLSDVESDSDIKATTSDGGIYLDNVSTNAEIGLSTSCGRISLSDVKCNSINGETSDGGIVLDYLDSHDIDLKTSDGSIKGILCGSMNDYSISSSTSDGSNNLPDTSTGDRTLKVNTRDGSIKVDFED